MAYGSYSDVIQQEFWSASQWNTKYFSAFLRWQYCQDVANNKTKFKFLDITFVNHVDGRGIYASTIHAQGSIANQNTSEKTAQNKITTTGNTVVTINEEKEVTHNADGTFPAWQVAARVWATGQSDSIVPQSAPAFSCLTTNIPKIPRVSGAGVTSSSLAMGSVQVIKINRQTTAYTHKLYYKFHNQSNWTEINTGNANGINADTYNWTTPNLASLIPNATGASCQVMVRTMSGSTIIGDSTTSFTLTVPTTYVPSISTITIAEGGSAVPSSYGMFVQSKSLLKVTISASGHSKSTIKTYRIEVDGKSYSGSSNVLTTNIINGSGTLSLKATVTDSRGRTATKTQNVSITAYSAPSISTFSAVRCTSNGTASDDGTYVKFSFKFAITALGNKNSRSFKLQVYANNAWSDLKSITDSYGTESTFITTTTYSVDNTYRFRAYCADYFSNATVERNVDPSFSLIDLGNDGKSIAFGGVADDNGTFHSKIPSRLKLYRHDGSYLNGKTPNLHPLYFDGKADNNSWLKILGMTTLNNHGVSIGAIDDKFGILGFKSDRTANGYDYSLLFDMSNGHLRYNGSIVLSAANHEGYVFPYIGECVGTDGTTGWVRVLRFNIIAAYANSYIEVEFTQRSAGGVCRLSFNWVSGNTTDPNLNGFFWEGANRNVRMTKSATSQWDLYIQKTEAWDHISVISVKTSPYMKDRVNITKQNALSTSVSGSNITAPKWIYLDLIYPVGTPKLGLDSVNPSTYLGGTWQAGYFAFGNRLNQHHRVLYIPESKDGETVKVNGWGGWISQKWKPYWTPDSGSGNDATTKNLVLWMRTA